MEGLFIEEIFIHCYEKDNLRGEERREYKAVLENHLKHTISKNFNTKIDSIELKRDSSSFTAVTMHGEIIHFDFNLFDYTCNINLNHKFNIALKMNRELVNKGIGRNK